MFPCSTLQSTLYFTTNFRSSAFPYKFLQWFPTAFKIKSRIFNMLYKICRSLVYFSSLISCYSCLHTFLQPYWTFNSLNAFFSLLHSSANRASYLSGPSHILFTLPGALPLGNPRFPKYLSLSIIPHYIMIACLTDFLFTRLYEPRGQGSYVLYSPIYSSSGLWHLVGN